MRIFDFDRGTPLEAAVPIIKAALEDEGLWLLPATTNKRSAIYTVRTADYERVFVPKDRIGVRPC